VKAFAHRAVSDAAPTKPDACCIQTSRRREPLNIASVSILPQWSSCMRLASRLTLLALTSCAPLASMTAQHVASAPTIPQVAKTAGQFTTLLAAVDAAGLTETLLGRGPFTLFAPTDEAFAKLPGGTVQELLKPENREKLRTILTYHVIAGRVTAAQARTVSRATTVAGQDVRISQRNDELRINDATVRIADVPASNGIIHVIDRVLIPSTDRNTGASASALELIDLAIRRGVPLFNAGQVESTVAIYEVATSALLAPGTSVSTEAQRALRQALGDTSGSTRDRAFTLRGGLDTARRSISGQMQMAGTR